MLNFADGEGTLEILEFSYKQLAHFRSKVVANNQGNGLYLVLVKLY